MGTVKSQDINILMVGYGDKPSNRQLQWLNILKGREDSGRFNVTYEKLTGKIQGKTWDEVYVDELV